MSEWNEWDAEVVQEQDSAGLQAYTDALTSEADTTGETGFQDAAWSAGSATEFETDAESWASYSADASTSAADNLDDAATAYAAGDASGGDFALRQAELDSERADWAGGVADTIDTTADTYAKQSYDTAVDASWDAAATSEAPLNTSAVYEAPADTSTSYDTTVDDSAY